MFSPGRTTNTGTPRRTRAAEEHTAHTREVENAQLTCRSKNLWYKIILFSSQGLNCLYSVDSYLSDID